MGLVSTRKRLVFMLMTLIFLFSALIIRLGYIQLVDGKMLQIRAAEQWYRDLPLGAPRGKILDANGSVIADSRDIYTVYLRPRAVTDSATVAATLASTFKLDYDKLITAIKQAAVSEITVARLVETDVADNLIKQKLNGVYFTVDSKRSYPRGDHMTQVLGFTNVDNQGQNGIEGYYNAHLTGIDGKALTEADIKGKQLDGSVTHYLPAIAGSDLTLTIDASIQAFALEAIISAQQEFKAKSASMLVLDAKTGGVVAAAITPSFDLNDIPRDDIDMLNLLSKNTLIVDVFEPGSTFKIFTTAAAIEHGVTGDSKSYFCPGYRMVDGQRIRCWRSIGHGSQKLVEGVKNSCNCVFMDMAQSLGSKNLYQKLTDFGFGSKTGVDFFGESAGIMMKQQSVKNVDLARIGFGQAIAVTPLQLAAGVAAAVNGGTLYAPYFVSSIKSATGDVYYDRQPTAVRQVISSSTSAKMRELLTAVVAEGSGKKAQVAGFSVGGKTGTAQKYKDGAIAQGKYVSSFVGFAPADDPQYVVLTILDEPGGYLYYGSLVAAPATSEVLTKIFQYKGIKGETPAPEQTVVMPELSGKTLVEALTTLKALGINAEVAGEGLNVQASVPVATTVIPKGDVILLRTD